VVSGTEEKKARRGRSISKQRQNYETKPITASGPQ
jgi:hypothetical protein